MKEKFIWYGILIVSLSFIAGILTAKMRQQVIEKPVPVVVEKPVVKIEYIDRHDTIKLVQVKKIPDTVHHTTTLTVHDTVEVIVPIFVQLYDTTFNDVRAEIQISGFNASLDRITLTNYRIPTTTVITSRQKRFTVGLGISYGLSGKSLSEGKFEPDLTVGINLSYNLFTF